MHLIFKDLDFSLQFHIFFFVNISRLLELEHLLLQLLGHLCTTHSIWGGGIELINLVLILPINLSTVALIHDRVLLANISTPWNILH